MKVALVVIDMDLVLIQILTKILQNLSKPFLLQLLY